MSDDWPAAGTLLAFRYRLVSRLETGGMAEIWHAQDELLARPVALKLPTGLDRARADVLQLAWREARMGARLSHPGIAAVHDYDEAVRPDGSVAPFVVMELLGGETLAARLVRGPLPWREAATIGAAVAEALAAAHTSGVVHRDVKPGNVMLTPTGVKILDFGISAVTGEPDDDETGATFGTPAYVAPERLDGKPAEPATDVYGLGVLLYEMVTGQPPYPVDTWEELAQARAGGTAALPATLPPAFRELVCRCLVDEPDRRPAAAEVNEILTELAEPEQPAPAEPAGAGGTRRSGRRRLVLWSGLVALAVSMLAVFASLGTSRQTEDAGRAPATAQPPASPSPAPRATTASVTPRSAATPAAPLDVDVALARVRSAIEAGRAQGQIRPDVAVDLLNLLGTLGRADGRQAEEQVSELRRKLRDRVSEGSVDAGRAEVLRDRLADLDQAVGSG
ncbi:serine/threonine-protein kinase [Actinoplanes sp. NPDC049599]|uniref:serine/threonine-protein kinase n=1 Tax=Actinoplanes sp. NPDC049599 TaxID=3363903 RepID=UPI00378CE9D7